MRDAVGTALAGVRKAKSEAKVSMRTEVTRAVVTAPADVLVLVRAGQGDLAAAGKVSSLELVEGGEDVVVSAVDLAQA
jgi:valyl-tRNA synthetase